MVRKEFIITLCDFKYIKISLSVIVCKAQSFHNYTDGSTPYCSLNVR